MPEWPNHNIRFSRFADVFSDLTVLFVKTHLLVLEERAVFGG